MLTALFNTTDKLQVISSSVADLEVVATYTDMVKSSGAWLSTNRQGTKITTAATTDILAAPAATEVRGINSLFIRNKHASTSNDVTVLYNANATLWELYKTNLAAGETLEYIEGVGFFKLAAAATGFGDILMRALIADQTGTNVATAQNWFPTLGAVAVEASTSYEMDMLLHTVRSAGTTSHTTSQLFAGTATVTAIQYTAFVNTADSDANIACNRTSAEVATATVVKAASTAAAEAIDIHIRGIVEINAAGTFIPQFIYSSAPGGAPTIERGSYIKLTKLGASFASRGTWT